MKKLFSLLLALTMIFALAAVSAPTAAAAEPVKAGFIFLHDENSTYDLNFMRAAKEVCEAEGVEYMQKVGVPEDSGCLTAAEELRSRGINVSRVHFDYINPLPKNTREVLSGFKKIIVCELNSGQFEAYLRNCFPEFEYIGCDKVQGQVFLVRDIIGAVAPELLKEQED